MYPVYFILLGEPPNVKPNIEFTYDSKEPQVQQVLSRLLSSNKEDKVEKPKLEFKRTLDNKDFFALSTTSSRNEEDQEKEKEEEEEEIVKSPAVQRQRRNSTAILVKELLRLTLEERDNPKSTANQKEQEDVGEEKKHEKHLKSLVIELEQDDEFFKMLLEELEQAASLQDATSERFKEDISTLETRMTKVVKGEIAIVRIIIYLVFSTTLYVGFSESKDRHVQLEKDIRNLHGRTNIPRHSRIRSLLPLCGKSQDPNGVVCGTTQQIQPTYQIENQGIQACI